MKPPTHPDPIENAREAAGPETRILGQILAAQNILFALPDNQRIAEFFAQSLVSIPGVSSCTICLGSATQQAGSLQHSACAKCGELRKLSKETLPISPDFQCELAGKPGSYSSAVSSSERRFGFFNFQVSQPEIFNLYWPFINNLANYVALSLENKLQKDLIQKAHNELERKVTERTQDLVAANIQLQQEIETRRQAEETLSAREEQIKQLIKASPVAMIVSYGADERVEFINAKFIELFGYTFEEMPDIAHWWPLAYPDENYREAIKALWQAKVEQTTKDKNEIEPIEATVVCKDGSRRQIEFRLSSIGDRRLVTFVDLTPHKQVLEALQERERHSQSLLRLSRKLEQAQTYGAMLSAARQEMIQTIGYKNLWVYLLSEDKTHFKSLAADGDVSDMVMSDEWAAILPIQGDPMLEAIAAAEEIVLIEDARTDPRTNKEIVEILGNRTLINIPILLFDQHLGSVGVGTFGEEGVRIPNAAEQEYLKSMASHLAVTMDRLHLLVGRKRVEEALRANNALLERIFAATEFMIAYLDADFNFIRVNRAYAEADEQAPEFFTGKNHFDLYPNAENEAIFRSVVETGQPYIAYAKPFEYKENPERGITYWNWTLQPVKETDGRVSGLIFSLINVTEREKATLAQQESDERYRILVNQASDGIFLTDPQGNFLDANPSGCDLLGYTQPQLLHLNMKDLISAEDQAKTPFQFDELHFGENVLSECLLVAQDGGLLPVEISGRVLDNGNFLGIVRDITERKHHEREREAMITVSNALRKATARSEIFTVLLDECLSLFAAEGAILVLPDATAHDLIAEMGRGPVGKNFTGLHLPRDQGVSGWVIQNRTPYLNDCAHADPIFHRPDLLGNAHSVAAVPLIAREQAIGALWIARRDRITEQELRLLNAIADIAANAIRRVTLHKQTEQQLRHLTALHQIDLAITTTFDTNITLTVVLHNVKDELDVDAAGILLLDNISNVLEYAAGTGFKTPGITDTQVTLRDGYAGRAVLEHRTIICPRLSDCGDFSRPVLLAQENFCAYYATPLVVKGQVKGVLELFRRQAFEPDAAWIGYFETLATQAAIAIENAYLFENLQRSNLELVQAYDATIEGWSRAMDLRDQETEGHTLRVTEIASRLAEKIGMSSQEKLDLRRGALLHDIGKVGVPDAILRKPGKLTEEEMQIMRLHTVYAYEMLSPIKYLKNALDIPYCHHEKWDGSGYPRGLKGEEIPMAARLFAAVDVFDALTSDRPYRAAWPREAALSYIQGQSGQHFDPQIARIFGELMAG